MNRTCTLVKILVLYLLLFLLTAVALAQRPPGTSSSLSDDGDAWGPDGNVNNTVSSSMAIIVIVLVLGFFILGTISIYIQNCGPASSSTETANTSFPTRGSDVVHGLDKSTIDTLPTFEYSAVKELKIGKGSLECAVCLSEFEENETLRLLPKCDHVFHSECIDAWLVGHATCPVCRAELLHDSTGSGSDKIDCIANESDHQVSEMSNDVRITINESETRNDVVIVNHAKFGTLPRSHSTGHSLIQPGENCERFTLKLPPEVRRQLLARIKLKRATSLVALPRQSSSRRGYRSSGGGGGEDSGSSRYGRHFGRSFISRLGSFKSSTSKVAVDGDVTAVCTVGKRCSEPIVTTSLEGLPRSLPV